MAMRTIDILEEQPPLSDLLRFVSAGDEVIIVEGNKPLAQLVPTATTSHEKPRRQFGSAKGMVWMAEDFDAPLEDFKDYME